MKKQLTTYLCEKPSQAADLSKFLGLSISHRKRNHYLDENKGIAVIHAVGHLFELAPPETYEATLQKRWDLNVLPVLPDEHKVVLKKEFVPIFNTCKKVLARTKLLVIATDPDNEGELIARDIIHHCNYQGMIKRALYSSTDNQALKKAFSDLLPATVTEQMAYEAELRRELDWSIGMNLTMAMTTILKSSGELKKGAFSVGRVITALALIVEQIEQQIKTFKPQKFYSVIAHCQSSTGETFDAKVSIPAKYLDKNIGKCLNVKVAEEFAKRIKGQSLRIENIVSLTKEKSAPLPYDLASLQVEMGSFDIEPDETLSLLQSLYDKPLSCVTYPRTDKRHLPEGMFLDVKQTINHLNDIKEIKKLSLDIDKKPSAFNDKKVEVHHGIIPTIKSTNLRQLSEKQILIYLAIALRYCQQFMAQYKYLSQEVTLSLGAVKLVAKSKKELELGWKSAALREIHKHSQSVDKSAKQATSQLLNIAKEDKVVVLDATVSSSETSPPKRLTPAKLIEAMQHPERYVNDEQIKSMLKEADGIGTSATRSDIIKRAFQKNLIRRKGKTVQPTPLFSKHADKFDTMNPGFTALMQRNFKLVIEGKMSKKEFVTQNNNVIKMALEKWKR